MLFIDFIFPLSLFHDGGPYHIETSLLVCSTNQLTGFYMIGTSVKTELMCYSKPSLPYFVKIPFRTYLRMVKIDSIEPFFFMFSNDKNRAKWKI